MQNSNFTLRSSQHFCFLLFDGFSNHCLANAVEPLRAANMISGKSLYRWSFASLSGAGIVSSSGLPVTPHAALEQVAGDLLLVMPSYGFLGYCQPPLRRALRRAEARFEGLATLDTGSWLLAYAGLLDGYQATIHWEEFAAFADGFPQVQAVRQRYTLDRDRITCSGATAAFDLVLELITRAHGPALALEVGQIFMTRLPESSILYEGVVRDRLVRRALMIMRDNLERPYRISTLSKALGCSQRKLEQQFRRDLGATPQRLYRRLRLSHIRKLLQETDLGIAEIALRSGYENVSAMTRAFRGEFGMTPSAMRRGVPTLM